jgi:hypothetical protein
MVRKQLDEFELPGAHCPAEPRVNLERRRNAQVAVDGVGLALQIGRLGGPATYRR